MRKPGLKLRAITIGALAFRTVLPARPPFTALNTTSGSSPALVAKVSASPIAAMLQATMIWFASFVTFPAPMAPVSVTPAPLLPRPRLPLGDPPPFPAAHDRRLTVDYLRLPAAHRRVQELDA